jgi:hypothetical protein
MSDKMNGFRCSLQGHLYLAVSINLLINLDSIDNNEIVCTVLLRTERDYREALNLFDI